VRRLLVCLVVAACGGDDGRGSTPVDGSTAGGTTVTGTIHGLDFGIVDAASAVAHNGTGTSSFATIILSSHSGICADANADVIRANRRELVLFVGVGSGNSLAAPTSTGTFAVASPGNGPYSTVTAEVVDGACAPVTSDTASAVSGSTTLTAIDGDRFAGTFDVTFDSGDHVTGSFDPQGCAAIGQGASQQPTCQ